ncbi:MAG: molybdate transport system substrate-binding protein [Pseudohongiellaceae bacterium]|jgi:molybdate transport system substrate-binding protein
MNARGRPKSLCDRSLPGLLSRATRSVLVWVLWLCCGCGEPGAQPVQLLAASSLGELAQSLAAGFEERTGRPVTVRLGSSSTLSRQQLQGVPGDLFLSADKLWVEALPVLQQRAWLGNRLAWVCPAGGPSVRPGEALSLAMGAPGVPLGRYAEAALSAANLPLPERIVRGHHARATLAIVSSGAVDAGVVYATDAALDSGVRTVALLDDDPDDPILYVAALLTADGQDLYDALQSSWMQEHASALGFVLLP